MIPASRYQETKIQGTSKLEAKIMLQDDGNSLKLFIRSDDPGEGHLPSATARKLGSYLNIAEHKHLLLMADIMYADTAEEIHDLFIQHRFKTAKDDEASDDDTPLNDPFDDSAAPSSSVGDAITSLVKDMSGNFSVSASGLSFGGGFGGGFSRPRKSRGNFGVPGISLNSSGRRRRDGASPAVERIATAEASDAATKSGIQGELFVYKALKSVLGSAFTHDNWTSELRHRAVPDLAEWTPVDDGFFADFTFVDRSGALTAWLKQQQTMGGPYEWTHNNSGKPTRYNIEVKSTYGRAEDPYHVSDWQFEEMKRMSQEASKAGKEVIDRFVVVRVAGVESANANLVVVPDLWQAFVDGECGVRARDGLWIIGK
jgi:hypothetical protein